MRGLLLLNLCTQLGFKRKKKPTGIAVGPQGVQDPHLLKGNPARFWGESIAIATVLGVGITTSSDSVLIVDRINCKGTAYLTAG